MAKTKHREGGNTNSPYWLIQCRVQPGMFRDEYLVFVDAVDPQNPNQTVPVQLLVDQRQVTSVRGKPKRNQPANGWLRVAFARKEKGFIQVILPQPASPIGENILVDESRVKQEAGA
jgi:hypothetical protein